MRFTADLRRRILQGQLAPGTRLTIDEIATSCAVSHIHSGGPRAGDMCGGSESTPM